MMSVVSTPTPVLIAIGPEWHPIRSHLTDWVVSNVRQAPQSIALLDTAQETPAGRIAGWIERSLNARLVLPGRDAPVSARGPWAGVTELLLDPDPFQAEQLYALGIWTRFANRRDRMRMRVSPTLAADIVAKAAGFDITLLTLVGEWQGQRVVIAGIDPIATEVTARAFRAIAQPAGDVGLSPWQSDLVQAAIERGLGVSGGQYMRIESRTGFPIDPRVAREADRLLERICHLLDTPTSAAVTQP